MKGMKRKGGKRKGRGKWERGRRGKGGSWGIDAPDGNVCNWNSLIDSLLSSFLN